MSASEGSPIPLEGDLSRFALRAVLERLADDLETGILTIQSNEDIIAISFSGGAVVGADALNETLEDGLGQALASEGLLTDEQFSTVLSRVRTERMRLGDVLLEEDLLGKEEYLAALRRYSIRLVEQVLAWDQGDFRFYGGEQVAQEKDFAPITIVEIFPAEESTWEEEEPASVPVEPLPQEPEPSLQEEVFETPLAELEEVELPEPVAPLEEPYEVEAAKEPSQGFGGMMLWLGPKLENAADWVPWLAPTVALLLLAITLLSQPSALLYSFGWLEPGRLEFETQLRSSAYSKIDRAAKTYFLLEGRFPDDLPTLVSRGLLSASDIVGSRGRILTYEPGDRGYVIRSAVTDGTDAGVSKEEAIGGDFFLDPEFVIQAAPDEPIPLVLLD